MPLGNTKMQEILKEYDQIREKNRSLLRKRTAQVQEKAPAYFEYHRQIISLCMQHANASLYPEGAAAAPSDYQQALNRLRLNKEQALVQAGFPKDYLEPIYDCAICKDTGFVNSGHCDCLKKRLIQLLYAQSGIQHLLEENNFDTLSYEYYQGDDLKAFQTAVEVSKAMTAHFSSQKDNLLFYGTVGCGKSFLSGCIAKELMDHGMSVVYFSAAQFFDVLHQNSLYNGLEDLYNYDLVIIDDLGAEMTNSFVTSALFAFLNERILREKSMIISTNLNLSELKERYSDRIASRIVQNFKLCRLSGPDIRILKRLSTRK